MSFWDQQLTLTIPFSTTVKKGVSDESDGTTSSLTQSNKISLLKEMNRDHTFKYSSKLQHLKGPQWSFAGQTLHATVTIKRREQSFWIDIIGYLNGQFSDGWGEQGYELPGEKDLHVNSFFPNDIAVHPKQDRRIFF